MAKDQLRSTTGHALRGLAHSSTQTVTAVLLQEGPQNARNAVRATTVTLESTTRKGRLGHALDPFGF